MRYPDFLKKDDTFAAIAPAFGCSEDPYLSCFLKAKEWFVNSGFKVIEGPNCRKADGIGISSTPENCGKELTEYYLSSDCQGLLSCGGGELMCETVDYIDFETIKNAPAKWFMGYSDNTNFTFLSNILCDTAAIYGPSIGAFGAGKLHECIYDAFSLLTGEKLTVSGYDSFELESLKSSENPFASYNLTEKKALKLFVGNKRVSEKISFSGRLIGGCLDCLGNLVGTKYDRVNDFNQKYGDDGIIWFLEACDLNLMSIRRTLWNLDRAGWFENAAGFIVGRPLASFATEMMGLDQYNAVYGILGKYNVPIIMDADLGHLPPAMPLISGALADVSCDEENISISHRIHCNQPTR